MTSTGDALVDVLKQIRTYHFARTSGRLDFKYRPMSNSTFDDRVFNV